MADRILNNEERHSQAWTKAKSYMEKRIALLRSRNDSDLDERKTARLRGSIAELKHLISLGEEIVIPHQDDELFKD